MKVWAHFLQQEFGPDPPKNCPPDWETGGPDYAAACDYILNRFVSLNQAETKQIYTHFTCATDTTQIKFVMSAVNGRKIWFGPRPVYWLKVQISSSKKTYGCVASSTNLISILHFSNWMYFSRRLRLYHQRRSSVDLEAPVVSLLSAKIPSRGTATNIWSEKRYHNLPSKTLFVSCIGIALVDNARNSFGWQC